MRRFLLSFLLIIGVALCGEYESTLEDLVFLNYQIQQTKKVKKPTQAKNIAELQDDKVYGLKKLALDALISSDDFLSALQQVNEEQENLKEAYKKKVKIQGESALLLERLQIENLELSKIMLDFAFNIQRDVNIFSQKQEVLNIVKTASEALQKQPTFDNARPKDPQTSKELKAYRETLMTYQEIIQYFLEYPRALFPQNALINLSVGWILQQLDAWIPIESTTLTLAKGVLSLIVLLILIALRPLLAKGVFLLINIFAHFSSKDHALRDKICRDIAKPVTYVLLVIGLDIAVSILYYPNVPPRKVEVWFGMSYIALSAWFSIIILNSYGVGLMSNILQKKDGFRKEAINLILKISYFVIILIGILVELTYLGFNVSTIMASLGIGGLAVALALKDMLANFFASVMLLFENSFSQGDWIVCDGLEGTVVEMGLRRTTIRTFDNALVLVPNSTLANGAILNWNRREMGRRIKMSIGVTYDSPMESIKQCIRDIREMLLAHPDIAKSSEDGIKVDSYEFALKQNIVSMQDLLGYKNNLFVVLDAFEDSSINILVYCFSKSVVWGDYLTTKEDVMLKIMKIVEKNNLSFAFPSQSVYVESLPKLEGSRLS